ncbi:ATP-binding protein [Arcobacter sp. YIC-80]|uniref:PAS domain-containing sensor histidine kinase n=1 Tax=Arcobacter sp. YIC-80 TaxID=3376683 RepID=UPI00384ECF5F
MGKTSSISLELKHILDNTIEGILIIENGFIKNVNKSLVKILNYENEDELIGNLATGILIPTSNKKYLKYNSRTFQEIALLSKTGTIIPAIIKIRTIILHEKECKMVSVLDMSEIKKKEEMLIEQSRLAAMGEMISVIAHQWRQPLNAVASITTRLKMKVKMNKLDKEFVEKKADEISDYLQYMSKTIDDFRDYFKPQKAQSLVTSQELIHDTMRILRTSFENQNISIVIENKKCVPLYLHKNEMIQVIINILNNSKDAFIHREIENATINISFDEKENYQAILIKDNAGGIKNDIISKIFTPYFTTKKSKNGTGLGLYICKSILEKHSNGKIDVENTEDGVLFKIIFFK